MNPSGSFLPRELPRAVLAATPLFCLGMPAAPGRADDGSFEAAHLERTGKVVYVPDMEVWEVDTRLSVAPDGGTTAEVHHRIISLSERANPAVEEFGQNFDSYV